MCQCEEILYKLSECVCESLLSLRMSKDRRRHPIYSLFSMLWPLFLRSVCLPVHCALIIKILILKKHCSISI